MANLIQVLTVFQGSKIEEDIWCTKTIDEGYMAWEDTKAAVGYPISAYETRKRVYIENVYYDISFNEIAKRHKSCIEFVNPNDQPPYAYSWWVAGNDNRIRLYKSNWDASD